MPDTDAGTVAHRRVYYFHGFDPATTAGYRRAFETSSARLGAEVTDLPGRPGWRVERDGVVTEVRHCRYEDLVRAWQEGPLWKRVARGLLTLGFYARDGALGRMARLGPLNFALALAPVLFIVGAVVIPVIGLTAIAPSVPRGIAAGAVATGAMLAIGLPLLYLHLVMDLFAYMRVLARGAGPVWRAFLDRARMMADTVDRESPGDVLLVGHSLGGVTAIHALDALLRGWPADRPIGLLTLGSTHGTVLVQEGDGRDRLAAAIGRIAQDARVFWVDVSSPRDAYCLPLLDPLCLIGARPGMHSPRVISARPGRTLRIPGDRRTLFQALRRQMGYLLAPAGGSAFDYADTITGRTSLRQRFATRSNSQGARMWQA